MTQQQDIRRAVPPWTLGWRLQRSLDFAGISAGSMADELGVVRSTVSRWMHDNGAPPRRAYVKAWADRCGVPHEWLEKGDDDRAGTTPEPGTGVITRSRVDNVRRSFFLVGAG